MLMSDPVIKFEIIKKFFALLEFLEIIPLPNILSSKK